MVSTMGILTIFYGIVVSYFARVAYGIELDVYDLTSLQHATSLVSTGLMDYYKGSEATKDVGMFSYPNYWWSAGAAWGALLDYWWYMENDTYSSLLTDSLLYQVGENQDYVPVEQASSEGNDDQAFWGFAVMAAAERNYTNPPSDKPQWLALAQAVFNTMSARWDTSTCGGGLRWQIFKWNNGYDYKNSVSNGALFHLAARLARYTGNQTYADWAEKTYDWMLDTRLVNEGDEYYFVYDGADVANDCAKVSDLQWTYNQGLVLSGCAYMYNFTESEVWHDRTKRFLESSKVFFYNDTILQEAACEGPGNCNNDQGSFKGFFARFLGLTAQLVPETRERALSWLHSSALAAAQSCSGGTDGHTCGLRWTQDGWDNQYSLGLQMSALEVMQNVRCLDRPPPYTANTGGSSKGNPSAGTKPRRPIQPPLDLHTGSYAAAGILTTIIALSLVACSIWLVI